MNVSIRIVLTAWLTFSSLSISISNASTAEFSKCISINKNNITLHRENVIVNVKAFTSTDPISSANIEDTLGRKKNSITSAEVTKEAFTRSKRIRNDIQTHFDEVALFSSDLHSVRNQSELLLMTGILKYMMDNSQITLIGDRPAGKGSPVKLFVDLKPTFTQTLLLDATGGDSWYQDFRTILEELEDARVRRIEDDAELDRFNMPYFHIGYVTKTEGNLSICSNAESQQDKNIVTEIIKLVDTIYIKPSPCLNETTFRADEASITSQECYVQIIKELDQCVTFIQRVKEDVILGLVASTQFLGKDAVSRSQLWCLLSSYGITTNRTVLLTDEDNFIEDYVKGAFRVEQGNNSSSSNQIANSSAIYVGVSLLVTVFVVALGIQYRRNERAKRLLRDRVLTREDIDAFLLGESRCGGGGDAENTLWGTIPYCRELEISKEEIFLGVADNYMDISLGSGAYGCVYHGRLLPTGVEVAVKTSKKGINATSGLKGLLSEIKVLSYVGVHENIIKLLGAYTAELENGLVYVVLELCQRGSLQNHLQTFQTREDTDYTDVRDVIPAESENPEYLTAKRISLLIRFSKEICSGMKFLAEKNVIHGDLATRNVLVTQNLSLKISDFGLSRRLYENINYVKSSGEHLPWKWLSPEALQRMEFSEKSDVWAYAVTTWEIFSYGNMPYPGLCWTSQFPQALEEGLRLDNPADCPPDLYATMLTCWEVNPERRPTFQEIQCRISNIS